MFRGGLPRPSCQESASAERGSPQGKPRLEVLAPPKRSRDEIVVERYLYSVVAAGCILIARYTGHKHGIALVASAQPEGIVPYDFRTETALTTTDTLHSALTLPICLHQSVNTSVLIDLGRSGLDSPTAKTASRSLCSGPSSCSQGRQHLSPGSSEEGARSSTRRPCSRRHHSLCTILRHSSAACSFVIKISRRAHRRPHRGIIPSTYPRRPRRSNRGPPKLLPYQAGDSAIVGSQRTAQRTSSKE